MSPGHPAATQPALCGIWVVDQTSVNDRALPASLSDSERWRRVIVQTADHVVFQHMDDTYVHYDSAFDLDTHRVTLAKATDTNWTASFASSQPAPEQLILDGDMDGRPVHLKLSLFERRKFPLVSRGFNWIQERPFNR